MNIEKIENERRLKILWIISLTLIPISLISYLYLLLTFFFGGLFITNFEVLNKTDIPIRFSPYGKINTRETGSILIYFNSSPYFPSIKRTGFLIKPNESRKITYDTDDSYLQGLIIEADNLVKDLKQENFEIKEGKIEIGEIRRLPDADKLLTRLVFKIGYKNFILYFMLFIGVTNSFFIFILIGIRNKIKKYGI